MNILPNTFGKKEWAFPPSITNRAMLWGKSFHISVTI
jgi:hypothetical protein